LRFIIQWRASGDLATDAGIAADAEALQARQGRLGRFTTSTKIVKISEPPDVRRLVGHNVRRLRIAAGLSQAELAERMVLLSAKAGLRAAEIANLTWDMVVDATGYISGLIELADTAAKKFRGRSIPVHPDLMAALAKWRQVAPPSAYVIASERGGRMRPLSVVVWFNRAFKNVGLKGCSSHSGHRAKGN
jgi:integrase